MIIGLVITWFFWSVIIGILVYYKRSWVNVLAIPIVLSIPVIVLNYIYPLLAILIPLIFYIILTIVMLIKLYKIKVKMNRDKKSID